MCDSIYEIRHTAENSPFTDVKGVFCIGDEPKSGLARDLGDRLQSRNVPFGTSGDCCQACDKTVRWTVLSIGDWSKSGLSEILARAKCQAPHL